MHPVKTSTAEKLDPREDPRTDRRAAHDAVLREIAEDAKVAPERYLQDSIVPEGGE